MSLCKTDLVTLGDQDSVSSHVCCSRHPMVIDWGLEGQTRQVTRVRSLPGAKQALAFQFPADLPHCLSHSPPRSLCGLPELDFIKHTAGSFSQEALEPGGLELRRQVWLEIGTERGSDSHHLLEPSSLSTLPFQHPTHFPSSPASSIDTIPSCHKWSRQSLAESWRLLFQAHSPSFLQKILPGLSQKKKKFLSSSDCFPSSLWPLWFKPPASLPGG